MECILDLVERHVSVRRYTGEPVPPEDVERIVEAARRAPTAWNLMPVTINVVRDQRLKEELAEAVGGQAHVARAPLFLVFSVDYHKLSEASRVEGIEPATPGLGHLIAAVADAGIMSGWAALAAEALGYGITFIAVYANPCRVAEILGHPSWVLPVIGLTVGKPAESPSPRPRQPRGAVMVYDDQPLAGRGGKVLEAYQPGRRARLFSHVLAPGGYLDRVTDAILECARKRGFILNTLGMDK